LCISGAMSFSILYRQIADLNLSLCFSKNLGMFSENCSHFWSCLCWNCFCGNINTSYLFHLVTLCSEMIFFVYNQRIPWTLWLEICDHKFVITKDHKIIVRFLRNWHGCKSYRTVGPRLSFRLLSFPVADKVVKLAISAKNPVWQTRPKLCHFLCKMFKSVLENVLTSSTVLRLKMHQI